MTQRDVARLPRSALLMFCAAYVLPGLFGRDPWKSADITAFGYMLGIAQGRSSWWAPTIGGLPADTALLPYWLGALFIKAFGGLVGPAIAARLPFALLLVLVLVLTWYAAYHLARTQAAQPLPLAFGGEAKPVDYARAIADGALLALIATLGLLQLGHETTPELLQLAGVALFAYALAASPFRDTQAKSAVVASLVALAASGAPSIALALAVVGALICRASSYELARKLVPWVLAGGALSALVATALGAWGWRLGTDKPFGTFIYELLRLLAWFAWPTGPLALYTLWRWRNRLADRHIAIPLGCVMVSLVACVAMGNSERALLLGLPSLAVLTAFALPTLQRTAAAAIDWFSVCFFSIFAAVIWVMYVSIQTGVPAQPARNVARLAPGYAPTFSLGVLLIAIAGTLAWAWLVKWRTGRSRHPLWKSLVLPASGVALGWLLAMTLLLEPFDHARSYRSLVTRIAPHVPAGSCLAAPGVPRAAVAALEYLGDYRVDAVTPAASTSCVMLVRIEARSTPASPGAGWKLVTRERRNTNDEEITALYRRPAPRK